MKPSRSIWPSALVLLLVGVGCGSNANLGADVNAAQQQDYGATKQMVIDILHSSDGKTALQEMFKDPSFKQQLVVSETDVSKAVEKTIQSSKSQSFLSQQAKDPQFAGVLAKAIQPELIQISKQLMKDPEYQKELLVLQKTPEFSKNMQDLLQTPEFRTQIMKIMTDAMDTPSFKVKFETSLKKAVLQSMPGAGSGKSSGQSGNSTSGSSSSGSSDSSSSENSTGNGGGES